MSDEGEERTPDISGVAAGRRNYIYNTMQDDDTRALDARAAYRDWRTGEQQQDGTTAVYDRDGVHRLTASDNTIQAEQGHAGDGEAVAEHAAQSGWRAVAVSGDDDFRRSAFIEGRARGLDVEGYKATERDEQAVQDRAQAIQAEKGPASAETQRTDRAQAVRDLQADELVGTYPDMTKEAGVVQAAQVFANEKIELGDDRVQFMSQIRDQVAERVQNGQDLGQINVREERATERETEREAEQAPER